MIAERFKFYKRIQGPEESINDFVVALKKLSRECEFGDFLKDALRDIFVCGIRTEKTQTRLLNEENLDFEKATKIALNMEMTEADMKGLKEKTEANTVNVIQKTYNSKPGVKRYSNPMVGSYESIHQKNVNQRGRYFNTDRYQKRRISSPEPNPRKYFICYNCRKPGHIARNCKEPKRINQFVGEYDPDEELDEEDLRFRVGGNSIKHVGMVDENAVDPLYMEIEVSGRKIHYEVDTGACVTCINDKMREKYFPKFELYSVKRSFNVITGDDVLILGAIKVEVKFRSKVHVLFMVVLQTKKHFTPLLGRTWLNILIPGWKKKLLEFKDCINMTSICDDVVKKNILLRKNCKLSEVEENKYLRRIREKYKSCFEHDGKPIKGYKANIVMKDGTIPIFCASRQIPYGMVEKVDRAIDRLVQSKKAHFVRHSNWATPIVVQPKKNGEVRICLDGKVSINRQAVVDHYPMPRFDDIMV